MLLFGISEDKMQCQRMKCCFHSFLLFNKDSKQDERGRGREKSWVNHASSSSDHHNSLPEKENSFLHNTINITNFGFIQTDQKYEAVSILHKLCVPPPPTPFFFSPPSFHVIFQCEQTLKFCQRK